MVILFLIFLGKHCTVSHNIHRFASPPTAHEGFNFSISSPTIVIFCLLDNNYSNIYEVISHLTVVLICISLKIVAIEHIFMCLLAICIFSLGKCLFKVFAHFGGLPWYPSGQDSASIAGGPGSSPGQGTKVPHATWCSQKVKKKKKKNQSIQFLPIFESGCFVIHFQQFSLYTGY